MKNQSKLEEALIWIWDSVMKAGDDKEQRIKNYIELTDKLRANSDIADKYHKQAVEYFLDTYCIKPNGYISDMEYYEKHVRDSDGDYE